MKYASILLWAALTLTASAAFAQNPDNRDRLSEIEQMAVQAKKHRSQPSEFKKAGIELFPEIGVGTHLVQSDVFRSQGIGSGQVYVHVLDAYVRPVSWMSLHVAGGLAADRFQTRTSVFWLDGAGNIRTRKLDDYETDALKFRSSVSEASVLIPATLQFHAGYATIRLGAEAIYGFRPRVRYDLTTETDRQWTEEKGVRITPWSYDFLASFSFAGQGVFVKYQPAMARRFPEPGPTLSCWTVGYRIGF
jgi:hypothetical protein